MIHSRFGASRIAIMVNGCLGFNNATRDFDVAPNDLSEDEQAAAEGHAAHHFSEKSLKLGFEPEDLIGSKFEKFTLDEVMAEHIKVYTNAVRDTKLKNPKMPAYIEKMVYMHSVGAYVFGTPDWFMIAGDTLYIKDLKYGFVLTDALEQMAHYGVSICDTFKLWFKIKKVVTTVVQPRADHMQGSVRTFEYTIQELMEWRDKFKTTIEAAQKSDAPRKAGPWCRYCPVRGNCRERILRTVFLSTHNKRIDELTDEEINALLYELPTIKKNIEAIQEHATILARGGKLYKDFKLVRQRVHAIPNDADKLVALAIAKGVKREDLFHPGKLKGKTALKPVLDKVDIDVNEHWTTPTAQTILVPLTHSSTAVSRTAAGVFKPIK